MVYRLPTVLGKTQLMEEKFTQCHITVKGYLSELEILICEDHLEVNAFWNNKHKS